MEITNTYIGIEKNNFIVEGYKAIAVGREALEKIDQDKKSKTPVAETTSDSLNAYSQASNEFVTNMEQSVGSVELHSQQQESVPNDEDLSPISMEPEESDTAMDIPVFDPVTQIITNPDEETGPDFVDDFGEKVSTEMQETQTNPFDLTGTVEPTIGEPVALEPVEVNENIFGMPNSQTPLTDESIQTPSYQSADSSVTLTTPKEEKTEAPQLPPEVNSQSQLTDTPKIQSVPVVNPNDSIDLEDKVNKMLDSTINLQRELKEISDILKRDRLHTEGVLNSAQQELNAVVA